MKSIYPELALCGSKNECPRTETVFFPISEVSEGTVSLDKRQIPEDRRQMIENKIGCALFVLISPKLS